MLEAENKSLKEEASKPVESTFTRSGGGQAPASNDRDWMGSMGTANRATLQSRGGGGGIGQIERPVTASAQNAKVREVQAELKNEQRDKRKLLE